MGPMHSRAPTRSDGRARRVGGTIDNVIIQAIELTRANHVVVLDARVGPDAEARFEAEAVRGARLVDLETELSDPDVAASVGGRHTLPPIVAFAQRVASWGIDPTTPVVIYDDRGGLLAAARAWWMLRAIGIPARVLDGGLAAARAAGLTERSTSPATRPPSSTWAVPSHWPGTVELTDVEEALRAGRTVVDVRAASRFRGEHEPIDPVAGHVPGAVNLPCSDNLGPDGYFLDGDALRARYGDLPSDAIVHCGSGVTACHTLLALAAAGLGTRDLWVGSFSQWCRRDRPIATTEP